jgi:3D (Asp-Asp-Asp) domain-containing protein
MRAARHTIPWHRMFVTGYTDRGLTATGTPARWGVVAVDPRVIPLGAWVRVAGYAAVFRAEDTGGLIVGRRVDIWFPTAAACYASTGWRGVRWSRRRADLG